MQFRLMIHAVIAAAIGGVGTTIGQLIADPNFDVHNWRRNIVTIGSGAALAVGAYFKSSPSQTKRIKHNNSIRNTIELERVANKAKIRKKVRTAMQTTTKSDKSDKSNRINKTNRNTRTVYPNKYNRNR